jgi:hypothetical protein
MLVFDGQLMGQPGRTWTIGTGRGDKDLDVQVYWLLGTSVRKMTTFSPIHSFPLAPNSMERQGGTCTSRSFREEIPLMEAKLTLSGSMDSGKLCASSMRGLLSQDSSCKMRSSCHLSTRDRLVDSVLPALGHLSVVMVQSGQDRNGNHPASFVCSGTR